MVRGRSVTTVCALCRHWRVDAPLVQGGIHDETLLSAVDRTTRHLRRRAASQSGYLVSAYSGTRSKAAEIGVQCDITLAPALRGQIARIDANGASNMPPDLIAQAREIQEIWRRVHEADPNAAAELAQIAIIQGQAFEVAVNSALRRLESQEPDQSQEETESRE